MFEGQKDLSAAEQELNALFGPMPGNVKKNLNSIFLRFYIYKYKLEKDRLKHLQAWQVPEELRQMLQNVAGYMRMPMGKGPEVEAEFLGRALGYYFAVMEYCMPYLGSVPLEYHQFLSLNSTIAAELKAIGKTVRWDLIKKRVSQLAQKYPNLPPQERQFLIQMAAAFR
jgi:hypothetical protein